MLESYEIETIEQLRAIADLLRLRIFDLLQDHPMTVTQLGEVLGEAPAKVHYHVRELERVGLLRLVETREKGGILEKYYQPIARNFSAEKFLLSVPLDEAMATITGWINQMKEGFQQAFRQTLAQKEQRPHVGLSFGRIYLTSEELKEIYKQINELLKPYEHRRNLGGEQEVLTAFIAYPQATPVSPAPSAQTAGAAMQGLSLGLIDYSRADLEKLVAQGKPQRVQIVGRCRFADDISPDLVDRAFEHFHLVGKLEASPAIREILMKKAL